LLVRGAPWIGLILRHRAAAPQLNLGWRHRLSALASLGLIAAAALLSPIMAAVTFALFLGLNLPFYRLLARRRGMFQAAGGVVLHFLHHLICVAALPVGIAQYVARAAPEAETPQQLPVGSPTT
jgi:hypothetical protein